MYLDTCNKHSVKFIVQDFSLLPKTININNINITTEDKWTLELQTAYPMIYNLCQTIINKPIQNPKDRRNARNYYYVLRCLQQGTGGQDAEIYVNIAYCMASIGHIPMNSTDAQRLDKPTYGDEYLNYKPLEYDLYLEAWGYFLYALYEANPITKKIYCSLGKCLMQLAYNQTHKSTHKHFRDWKCIAYQYYLKGLQESNTTQQEKYIRRGDEYLSLTSQNQPSYEKLQHTRKEDQIQELKQWQVEFSTQPKITQKIKNLDFTEPLPKGLLVQLQTVIRRYKTVKTTKSYTEDQTPITFTPEIFGGFPSFPFGLQTNSRSITTKSYAEDKNLNSESHDIDIATTTKFVEDHEISNPANPNKTSSDITKQTHQVDLRHNSANISHHDQGVHTTNEISKPINPDQTSAYISTAGNNSTFHPLSSPGTDHNCWLWIMVVVLVVIIILVCVKSILKEQQPLKIINKEHDPQD